MKTLRQVGQNHVEIIESPIPRPRAGEVLIRTAASAICGSEMHSYRGRGYPDGNPGHEAAGVVEELGEGVQSLAVGQRVGVSAVAGCGACDYCRLGQYTWCESYKTYHDMHAEYFTVPALACHPLPDDVPWGVGALIAGDGLGVPYHSSRKFSGPEVRFVAVFGLGPVGLGHALVQSHLGRTVIGIDRSAERLRYARQLGAAHTLDAASDDLPSQVRDLTGGRGADVSIEAAGRPVTLRSCFASARKGGMVLLNGEQGALELSPSADFIRRDITAAGSWFYHFSEYHDMLALWRGGLAVDSLISHRFPLEKAGEAYDAMNAARTAKIVFEYDL